MIKFLENESDYKEIVKEGTWLVDFYADWCGPCKMLGVELEKLEDTNILKVNTDQFSDLALSYGVMSIPAIFLLKDGEVVKNSVGFKTLEELNEFIKD